MKRNVVVGLGEIGKPISSILSGSQIVVGFDTNDKLMDKEKYKKYENLSTSFLHICIPYNEKFITNVIHLSKKFNPEFIVIHSTVSPYTTKILQDQINIPIIYSATRGVHRRMIHDLKRYTKFFAIEYNAPNKNNAEKQFKKLMHSCDIKTRKMSKPVTLELAKIICDTSYLGWLINYAQLSNMIAIQHGINYDEMWSFSDEIHEFLGNRPKMFPGYIGGHCVIPNLDLLHNQTLDLIKKMNEIYAKKVKNAKTIAKKYGSK